MKKTLKKALSLILSLALMLACLVCAFSCATVSAQTTLPSQMLKLTGPNWGSDANPYAVIVRAGGLTSGHTYRLSMYKSPSLSVKYNYYVNGTTWTQFSPAFTVSNGLSSCEFSINSTYIEVRFNVGGTGKSFYVSDIKLVDVTANSDTNLLNDPTVSGDFTKWSGQMLNANQQTADTDISARAVLVDFDADIMGVLIPPEKNTDYPEKELKITAPNFGSDANPYAIIFRKGGLTAGHTYRLAMFQKGLLGVKYNLYANGTTWTQYSMESVANGAYYIYQFVPTQSYVEIRFNIGGTGKTSYVADLKLYDITDPETNLINDIATSGDTERWTKQMLNANQQTADADLGTTVTVQDFDKSDFGIIDEPEEPVIPTKMFRLKHSSENGALAFGFSNPVAGHTYEVSMIQGGVQKVAAMSTNWSAYERKDAAVSERDGYTVYTFVPTYSSYCQIYISGVEADSVFFVSDIKVTDITTNNLVRIVGDDEAWKGAMITGDPMLYQNAAGGSAALMDYDAVALGDTEAEKPAQEPERAIKITAPVYDGGNNNPAAIMTKATLTAGHTYRLTMYKKGILGVQYNEYTNNVWTPHPIYGISDNDGFTVYHFVPTKDYVELRLSIGASGKRSYVSGIKLYDIEDESKTNLLNDPTESGNFNNWGTHMLNSNQMGSGGAATVYGDTATVMGNNTAVLIDYDIHHDHTAGDSWESDADGHWKICTECGDEVDEAEHTAGEWITDIEATAQAVGHKYIACTVCGRILEEDDIPQLVVSHTPGDINNDGAVNNKDLTRLFQYLSDWDVEVDETALDVNGDGAVNNKDLTRLFQYLSDWDVVIF